VSSSDLGNHINPGPKGVNRLLQGRRHFWREACKIRVDDRLRVAQKIAFGDLSRPRSLL
jgi:hypothetical protein